MTTYHKVTVELDARHFELLRSLCEHKDMDVNLIVSEAIWNFGEQVGMFEDSLLSQLYGETIYRVSSITELILNLKERQEERERQGINQIDHVADK